MSKRGRERERGRDETQMLKREGVADRKSQGLTVMMRIAIADCTGTDS